MKITRRQLRLLINEGINNYHDDIYLLQEGTASTILGIIKGSNIKPLVNPSLVSESEIYELMQPLIQEDMGGIDNAYSLLEELDREKDSWTYVPVWGAFELIAPKNVPAVKVKVAKRIFKEAGKTDALPIIDSIVDYLINERGYQKIGTPVASR